MKRIISLILLVLCAQMVHAQEPVSPFAWRASTLAGTYIGPAGRRAVFGARLEASVEAPAGLRLYGRLDGTAQGDGGAAAAGLANIDSFTNGEIYFCLSRPVAAGVGPALLYGWSVPLERTEQVLEKTPRTALVGLLATNSRSWILLGVGMHEAAGDVDVPNIDSPGPWSWNKFRVIASGSILIDGRTSFAGEVIAGEHSFARGYVVVQVGGR